MAIPRDNSTLARLKNLEQELQRLRGYIANRGIPGTLTTPAAQVTVTSATWVEVFTLAGVRQNATWEIRFTAACAVGTTGQVRAVIAGTSTELQAPVDVLDGQTLQADWPLTVPGALDDYVVVEIQAQRVTGTGAFTVRPYSLANA